MRPCYKLTTVAAAAGAKAKTTLSIMGEIGFWGVQAKEFVAAIKAVDTDEIEVEIDSIGGDMFAASTIYNTLRASGKKIVTTVMGLAASSASYIFMAGDVRKMPGNAFLMIHKPWAVVAGNDTELMDTAANLTKFGTKMGATYQDRSGMTDEQFATVMKDTDTWLDADEALELKLATEIGDEIHVSASFDLERAELPKNVVGIYAKASKTAKTESTTEPEQIRALAVAGGLDDGEAATIALACSTLEEAEGRILAAKNIKVLAKIAGKMDLVANALKTNMSVADFRKKVIEMREAEDEHTDNTPPPKKDKPGAKTGTQASLDPAAVWGKIEKRREDQRAQRTKR